MVRSLLALFLFFAAMPAYAQNWNGDGDGSERLQKLEDEVQRLQQQGGRGTGSGAGLGGAAAQQLDQRLTTLEAQVRQLTGDLEKVQYQTAQLSQQFAKNQQDLDVRFNEIGQQLAQIQQQQQQAAAAPAPAPAASAPATGAEKETSDAPAAAGKNAGGAQAVYDDGFAKLRQADYPGAEKAFKQFLANYATNPLAGNATYWLGETYYVRGQFKEAAVTFADGYQKYPKNSKAPDNLLKLAMSLSSLGSKSDACLTLNELKSKYPGAAPTVLTRATAERKKLACK